MNRDEALEKLCEISKEECDGFVKLANIIGYLGSFRMSDEAIMSFYDNKDEAYKIIDELLDVSYKEFKNPFATIQERE